MCNIGQTKSLKTYNNKTWSDWT